MRQAILLAGVVGSVLAAKTGPTFYTPERVAIARANLERHAWAQAIQRRIFATGDRITYYIGPTYTAADVYAAQSDEFIWQLQPPTTIPRVVFPRDSISRCPVHGEALRRINAFNAWRIDPVKQPYKVQCPVGGEWYPSNAYHEGDLDSGPFPDDGSGCVHEGIRYFFLREYAHMVYGSVVIPTLRSLSQAYQLTGDPRYGRKGVILLARVAMEYPNYGWDEADGDMENRFDRTYLGPWNNRHPHYRWKQGGMVTDLIWETFCLEALAYAYDGLWAYMDQDADLLAFLRRQGLPVASANDLRQYIQTYILRAGMRALQAGWIRGNEGFHQAAALAVALVLDDVSDRRPNSLDMVAYAYHGQGRAVDIMRNGLLPDGGGHESPNYSLIKLDFIRVSRLMEAFRQRHPELLPVARYPDLFADPKAKALFDYYIDVLASDGFYPSVGDCGGLRDMRRRTTPVVSGLTEQNVFAVERYGDPRHARACFDAEGNLRTGDLWEPFPEEAIRDLAARPEAEIRRASRLLDSYGVAILESGDFQRRRSLVLNYASIMGHRQLDMLNLELYARQLYLLQDLGYPKTWDYRWQWDAHSLAHNTVTVDETQPPLGSSGGVLRLFATAGGVHVVSASHAAYQGVALGRADAVPVGVYERTVVLVDVDEDRFYAVDLFAVDGGDQHDQSWHAFAAVPQAPSLPWSESVPGTLAGEGVALFAGYTDRWGRERPKGDFASFVDQVRRATLAEPAAWTWQTGVAEGDELRLHVVPLGGAAEVIMGKGRSPVRDPLDYLMVRRRPVDGGASRFLTVLDPYQGEPVVRSVRLVREDPLTVELELADERHEITLNTAPGPAAAMAARPLGLRVVARRDGVTRRDVRIGTQADTPVAGWATGQVREIVAGATGHPQMIIASADDTDAWLPGRTIRVHSPQRSAAYTLVAVEKLGAGVCRATLDKTVLLAEGPLGDAGDGELRLDAHLLFARDLGGSVATAEGFSARVAAASQDGLLRLDPATVRGEVPGAGTMVRLWQTAAGDRVETPVIRMTP